MITVSCPGCKKGATLVSVVRHGELPSLHYRCDDCQTRGIGCETEVQAGVAFTDEPVRLKALGGRGGKLLSEEQAQDITVAELRRRFMSATDQTIQEVTKVCIDIVKKLDGRVDWKT